MKKYLLILSLACISFFAKAQGDDPAKKADKIQALKTAFITQKLQLTSEEAQKFWPVYGNYEREISQLLKNNRDGGDIVDTDEKLLNIRKKYRPEFVRLIGQPRMNTLFHAEREFRGVLLRHINNRQEHEPQRMRR